MHDGILCMQVDIGHVHADTGHVVHEHWHVVHACWYSQFNKCYRHVRNIVHVKFDTDHPPYPTECRQIPCEPVQFEAIAVETSAKRFFTAIYPCLQTAAIVIQPL